MSRASIATLTAASALLLTGCGSGFDRSSGDPIRDAISAWAGATSFHAKTVFGASGRIMDFYVINGGAVEIDDMTPSYQVQYRFVDGKEYVLADAGFYRIFGGDVGVGPLAGRWVLRPGDVNSMVARLVANVSAEAECVLGGRHFALTGSQGDVRVYSDGVAAGAGLPLRLELPAAGPPLPKTIEQIAVADRSEPLCVRALGFTGDSVGGEHIRIVLDSYNAVPAIVAPTSAIDLTRS